MNIKSCEHCGVVLDLDVLEFPDNIYKEDGSVDGKLGAWSYEAGDYKPYVRCPICETCITKDD